MPDITLEEAYAAIRNMACNLVAGSLPEGMAEFIGPDECERLFALSLTDADNTIPPEFLKVFRAAFADIDLDGE